MDIWRLDATAQAELVSNGEVSPLELVDAAIARIEQLDPALGALVDTRFEQARQDAAGALPDGPFRGVPLLVKDAVQHSRGDRYQHGMRFLAARDYRCADDSELVRRYRAAGFILLGRTKVPEMTASPSTEPLAHGPARNPWNPAYTPGGSSGGSAIAVAAGMTPVAHGNDMGGSIRIPAACCSLVGLKPSRHRTSIAPYGEYWGPLTHEHVLTRTVRDSAGVLDATAGAAPGDLHTAPPPKRPWRELAGGVVEPLRIGVVLDHPFGATVDPQCVAAVRAVADQLAAEGHEVSAAAAGPLGDVAALGALGTVVACGIAHAVDGFEAALDEYVDDLEPATRASLDQGRATSAAALMAAIDEMARFSRDIAAAYGDFDLLLTPSLPTPPPRLGVMHPLRPLDELLVAQGDIASFALPFDITGQPAVSLPTAFADSGLPIGVQLVAPYAREDLLFPIAAGLERHFDWPRHWPAGLE